jgi:carboxypeptidase T
MSLRSELSSSRVDRFLAALDRLSALADDGAIDLWQSALSNPEINLRMIAWRRYRQQFPRLSRESFAPQIVRFRYGKQDLARIAGTSKAEVAVFAEDSGTIAAATPYSLDRLAAAGVSAEVLYPTISEMADAARAGDQRAVALYEGYLKSVQPMGTEVRIAVVDLSRHITPAPGYSTWLGDGEDFVLKSDQWLACLDMFQSDGSPASIAAHVNEQYTRRGYTLAGFYSPAEFSSVVDRFFPGKTFKSGTSASQPLKGTLAPALSNGKFHSYQDALNECQALALAHPDLAQVVNLGASYEGRQIFALKISRNPSADDPTKPDVLVAGCHHAREWISVEPPMYFANRLVNQYLTDDQARYLVDHLQIWIVPVVNPDGLTYSQGSANDQLDAVRLWRKNRRPINPQGCASGIGVDLNRNYDYEWRLPGDQPCPYFFDDVGASDDPNNEVYRGPSPGSEPELKALQVLTNDPNRHFAARIDYHNYKQLILYPWGYQTSGSADALAQSTLAKRMSDLALASSSVFYQPEQAIDLYITTGSSTDYSYAVNRVPAPFVVELRPDCCDFNIPESEIDPIDRESWAGAATVMDWAAGPPILQAVQAYQQDQAGAFSSLVYSSRWVDSGAGRQQVIDARFPVLQPGPIQVRLQFSKPMSAAAQPVVTLGRQPPFNELSVGPSAPGEGWQTTAYSNDTWVGETAIPSGGDTTSSWRLSVAAADQVPLSLDANPSTKATYTAGSGGWQGYEDPMGSGTLGGVDLNSVLPPSLDSTRLNVRVDAPAGGERLASGDPLTVSWTVGTGTGFSPAGEQIWLSTDSGVSHFQIADGIPGSANTYIVTLPAVATSQARIRVLVQDGATGNYTFGDNPANFTIGENVGSALAVRVVSSNVLENSWSDSPTPGHGSSASGQSQLAITLNVTNSGSVAIATPFIGVDTLTRNILLSREPDTNQAAGARQPIDAGPGQILYPGQSAQVVVNLGLINRKKFSLAVNAFGAPVGGSVMPSSAVTVWQGKPRSQ